MVQDLGPLLLQKRNLVSAVVMLALFFAGAGFGASRYLAHHATYDRVLGVVILCVAGLLAWLAWFMATQRWEVYRTASSPTGTERSFGFVSRCRSSTPARSMT